MSLDEIAAEAGTSKTVLYRHFGDRTGLYVCVVESVHDYIRSNLFDRERMTPLPHDIPGPDNDLNEKLDHYFQRAMADAAAYEAACRRVAQVIGRFMAAT